MVATKASPPARPAEEINRGAYSGLPVPRFVSLKTDRVNVRGGPSREHDVTWVFTKPGLPVEIVAEFENWRRIRDVDGQEGWVYHSLLSGKRTALIAPWSKEADALAAGRPHGGRPRQRPPPAGRARHRPRLPRRLVPAGGRGLRRLDPAGPAVGRLSQ